MVPTSPIECRRESYECLRAACYEVTPHHCLRRHPGDEHTQLLCAVLRYPELGFPRDPPADCVAMHLACDGR